MKPPFPRWFLEASTPAERQDLLDFIATADTTPEDTTTPSDQEEL